MLLTFRSHKIAFTADIEKAFLQMELNTQDREYLTGLREQHSSQKNKNISGERVARGKVVLIHHETPRNQWKLGVIIQLHQGKDGLVRSVTLRTAKGNLISRPIEKLYHLEVLAEEDNLQSPKDKFKNPEEIRSTSEKRTQRASAQRAAVKIKELSKLNELSILLPYTCVNLYNQHFIAGPGKCNEISTLTVNYVRVISHHYVRH